MRPSITRCHCRALRGGRVTSGCAQAPGRNVPVGSGRVSAASGPGGAGWGCWLGMACLGHVYVQSLAYSSDTGPPSPLTAAHSAGGGGGGCLCT